ncbi:MAG: BatA domain-containing protein [Flavobacteriales bacterium]
MAFLYPSFLWALTALAIPVLIHLFQLRRFKRIDFPNVRFLQEVTQQTRSRKKVRHWLVLLARLLALACLVFAFAQPYLKSSAGSTAPGQRAVGLYLDDSWSMDGQNPKGRLLDQARSDAQQTVMAFGRTDRFQVLTNRMEGRQQLLLGRDEALAAVSQVDAGPYAKPLSQVMLRQREALAQSDLLGRQAFLFTDLQRNITDVDAWTNDTAVRTVIVPLEASATDNLSIDSAWFESPVRRLGQAEALHVRVRNHADGPVHDVPLRLTIDGRQRAMAAITMEAGAVADSVLHFYNDAPGNHYAQLSIEDRPIIFDNTYNIAWHTASKLNVMLVAADAPGDADIKAIFSGDSLHNFTVQPWRQLDLGALAKQDLVVLNGLPEIPSGLANALRGFTEGGGSLALYPAMGADLTSYRNALGLFGTGFSTLDTNTVKVARIDLDAPFFRDVFSTMPANVDLPQVRARYRLSPPPAADALLRLQDGSAFLCAVHAAKGRAYFCASPLAPAGGNFARHALFVTSLLRMAELARPAGPLSHVIGDEATIPLDGVDLSGDAVPHLLGPGGTDIIPEVRRTMQGSSLVLHDAELQPGPYAVTNGSDTLEVVALNPPRGEGDLAAYTADELREALKAKGLNTISVLDMKGDSMAASLSELDKGSKLWIWFIIAALVFLVLETVLIRFSK